jgi:ankyrin repeat protein
MVRSQNLIVVVAHCLLFTLLFPGPAAADIELFGANLLLQAIRAQDLPEVESITIRGGNLEIFDAEQRTPIIHAAVVGNSDIVELLTKNRAKVNHRDKQGNTALFYAAGSGHIDVMEVLLEYGGKPDLDNKQGQTPLITAAAKGQISAVQLLLDRKADATHRDYTGRSALMWAEWNRRNDIVALLRKAGVRE